MRASTTSAILFHRSSRLPVVSRHGPSLTIQTLKGLLTLVAVCIAGLAQAQIPIGQMQNFSALPPVTSFSSKNVAGAGNSIATAVDMDASVQTNTAASINTVLLTAAGAAPANNATAQWSSGGGYLVTRPTGNSYTILMATITNSTGAGLSSVVISYVFGMPSALAGEDAELAGHRVYYSTTGLENSWTLIPELTSATPTPVAGSLLHTLSVSIPVNGLLYLIWVDDNGGPATDGSFSIDNFLVSTAIACPTITTQPANTTNVQNRTVSISVVASGPGLTYQWSRVGSGALSDGPTGNGSTIAGATTATLTITNAQTADTGDYFVVVSNPCSGGPVTSATAHLEINADNQAPQFVSARGVATDPLSFVVALDEALCTDPSCGYDSTFFPFVWTVTDSVSGDRTLGDVTSAVINGNVVTLTLQFPRTQGTIYKISVSDSGPGFQVTDLAGNAMADGTFILTSPTATFQQGDANGYAGTHDTEVRQNTPDDATLGTRDFFNVDQSDNTIGGGTAGPVDGLIRFDDIFGSNPTQVPFGSTILRVTLTLSSSQANANGNPVNMHRMLASWSETTTTWNTLVNGVDPDGIEAAVTPDVTGFDTALTVPFVITLDSDVYPGMLATAQAWSDGAANNGWVLLPTGTDGYRADSSEAANVANRPLLTVDYRVNPCTTAPSVVTQPPASTTVAEGSTAVINVGVHTCGTTTYQWKKAGVDVPGQTSESLRIVNVTPGDAGSYTLRVTNPNGFVDTAAAALVVTADTTRPVLTHAVSSNGTTIVLTFNKQLAASAQTASHYTLSGGATVSAAVLVNSANSATVTLTTSARTTSSTLTITGVTDNRASANLINPNPTLVGITVISVAAGSEWTSSWLYNTNNLDGTPTWKDTGFVPGADWLTGNALFGTEVDAATLAGLPAAIVTPIPPNTNTPPDFVTAYFRKSVTLSALPGGMTYVLEHAIDDGAVFYWDGVEFGRFDMTNGPVVYSTKATTAGEASQQSIALPASANGGGTHLLAVEVHQGGATTSSDMVFGAQIVAVSGPAPSLSISHSGGSNTVSWTADSHWRLMRSAVVTGPYTAVGGNPFHTFTVPAAANTNNAFFELQYNPNP
jgi:hypothetical protein